MSDYFPQEVLVEILTRLPVKSIIQCTTVCKPWYSLITSPNFISAHLNCNNNHDYLLVRHCYVSPENEDDSDDENSATEIYALYRDTENFEKYTQFDELPYKPRSYFNVVGSCKGLVCLSDDLSCYTDRFYLWNPSIRKSLKLPEPIFVFDTHGPFAHTLGFGFDSVSNDYKVVRIVHTGWYNDKVPPDVELYKLSTGVWEDITCVSPPFMFFEKLPGFFVNGACHWVASKRGNEETQNMIVSFDVHEERFLEMMLPGSLVNEFCGLDGDGMLLFSSDESLCLAFTSSEKDDLGTFLWEKLNPEYSGHDKRIDIWMMKDYGDPNSWVKRFSINLPDITFNVGVVDEFYSMCHGGRERQVAHFLRKPIASRKNGDIFWRADNGLLVSYDAAAREIKNLGIRNATFIPYDNALYVSTYKESLVLLGRQVKGAEEVPKAKTERSPENHMDKVMYFLKDAYEKANDQEKIRFQAHYPFLG